MAAPISDTQDFGYAGPGSIGDKVWNDLDGDGFQDPGEPGIPGVTITATATIGGSTFTVTTMTGPDGTYQFDGLPLTTFTVTVDEATLPPGVAPTGDPDAVRDGTSTVTLTVANPVSDVQDFGYQGPGSIGDLIWNDLNGDGIVDPGEPGMPGVTVTITTTIAGSPVTYTTTTGPDGTYEVAGLPLGNFTVTVDPTALPPGVLPTGDPDGGNDNTAAVTLTDAAPTSDTQDFGYQGAGAIGNQIWNDLDADGVQEPGEPGIPGVTVTITTTIAGSPITYTTTTGPDGTYTIAGLPLGDFTVTIDETTLPTAMVQTYDADGTGTANTSTVTLTAAAPTVDTQDFGYTGNGVIGDLIWNDLDGDGIVDVGEPGIAGITVTVTTVINGETVIYTAVTDASGAYLIAGLPLGSYTVVVDPTALPAGMTQTGDPDATKDNTSTVTLTTAAPSSDAEDFGYQGPGVIGDLIWNDLDGDGIVDVGEPGLPGVTVTVTTTINGSPVTYTATTGPTGAYEISGLALGDFTVTVDPTTLPPGVLPTGDPDGGNDNTAAVTLTAAAPTSDTQDFGYQGPGSIGDVVWVDLDGDGTQDAGEPGIPGVTVTITTTIDGSIVLYSATTDGNGVYTAAGLPLGVFTVAVDAATLPAGVTPTFDADGTGTANTSTVTLTAAAPTSDTQDFGYRGPGAIGDLIWNDLDGDGIADPDEPGLPGITITATSIIDGIPVTVSTVTGPDGSYSLAGLPLGEWTVAVDPATLPPGVVPTGDPDGTTDNTTVVTLTAATPTSDAQDFGYQGPGAIGDLIWNDLNGNRVAELGEPGLPGVTVTITTTIAGSPVAYTTTTGPDGTYEVAGLPLGAFTVAVDPADIPAGLNPTSDPDGGNDHTSAVTLTAAAPTSDTQDFGYTGPGVIGDLIWNDLDGDGTQDPGEPGIPGVTVSVTTLVNGSPVTYTSTTAPDGSYEFVGLPLGTFTVAVDPSTLPPGVVPTGDPDGGNDSTSTLTLTAAAPTSDTQDFGYQGPGTIGDLIWNDQDGDGIRDPGEPGLPGVTVTITTTVAGAPVAYTTTTEPDGTYSVSGLPLGDFTVTVDPATLPVGVQPTGDPDGGNDHTAAVTLTAAVPTSDTQDFGYQGPGSIGDLVWSDLNSNGVVDPDEPGIPGIDITITTTIAGTTVTYTTTTGPDGTYSVPGLPLGSYTVTLDPSDLPAGSLPTGDGDGLATPNVSVTTLTALDPTTDTQDFGQHLPARIGDLIWNDLNGNGLQDPDEPGIGGVTVHLTGTDGFGQSVDLTAVTSASGAYLFSNLVPGVYTITVTPPSGYAVAPVQQGTDPEIDSNGLTTTVTLTSGMGALGVDTGLFIPANLSGKVYADLDVGGSPDPADPGIPGVTLTLTGTNGLGEAITLTTTTGPDGTFQFPNLPPGNYTVTETQPPAWSDGADTSPPGTTSSTNDVITQITVTSGNPVAGLLFGEQGWPVTGKVMVDDTGGPVPGVTLTLRGIDVLGNPVERTVVTKSCNTTNATDCVEGGYEFSNVPPGTYTLVETQPPGFGQGTVEPTDSIEIVVSGGPVVGQDFSEKTSSLAGVVYVDVNNNGVHDPGEAINPGVTITLVGVDVNGKPVNLTTTSGSDGTWSFPHLIAGEYTITQTQPASLNDGATTAGTVGGAVSPNVITVQLAPGVAATNYLFGDVPKSQAGQLPKTGGSPTFPLGVGLQVSLLGLLLVAVGRRRKAQPQQR